MSVYLLTSGQGINSFGYSPISPCASNATSIAKFRLDISTWYNGYNNNADLSTWYNGYNNADEFVFYIPARSLPIEARDVMNLREAAVVNRIGDLANKKMCLMLERLNTGDSVESTMYTRMV